MTSEAPRLSILLPVRNEGTNLRLIIKMLRGVVEVPYEALVVYDNPSDDAVPAIAQMAASHPELRGVENPLGSGIINAFRAGVAAARGQYVVIFAVDDVVPVLA